MVLAAVGRCGVVDADRSAGGVPIEWKGNAGPSQTIVVRYSGTLRIWKWQASANGVIPWMICTMRDTRVECDHGQVDTAGIDMPAFSASV